MRDARSSPRSDGHAMNTTSLERFTALPKAELHVHLEGSIEPPTVVELAARHGVPLTVEEAASRYAPGDFAQFIEAFLWVTSFLRGPEDYALIARRFADPCNGRMFCTPKSRSPLA